MKTLHKAIQDYLFVRRALGYLLKREGSWLPDFASFLARRGSEFITTDLALEWATRSKRASRYSCSKHLAMVRGLAKYLHASDPRNQIPPRDLLPYHQSRIALHIYSPGEVEALMRACRKLHGKLKPYTYATLIGLLAVTGMRRGEAINLNRTDIDTRERVITIRHSKFGKSREVPIHATTVAALQDYAQRRDRILRHSEVPSFFLSETGRRLSPENIWETFNRLRGYASLNHLSPRPRIHDLRHTFVVRTLLRWYSEESNPEHRLALLSTYLGHVSPSSTYWYLTGTPELMALAAKRLEQSSGDFS